VVRRARLDAELVRRGLARSREQAAELVHAGRVRVSGTTATKPATAVEPNTPVLVEADADDPGYASRGGHKLAGALDALPIRVDDRRVLDAGASTGGFTDVLLRRGAREVVAVDVGYGQLAWNLRTDPRVTVHDRTNVRELTPEVIGGRADLTVADLSFIPLTLVLPALTECTETDLLPMVKPQFEVGKELVGPKGVVRDPELRQRAVEKVAVRAYELGWGTRGLVRSPLPGPAGNVEFFLWLRRDAPPADRAEIEKVVVTE
jgi:23S rRNA (cytidine1920-2'-O)/16S rRNA (cytidine1409-2'-O)-methyltransferase